MMLLIEVFLQVCLPAFTLVFIGWAMDRRFGLDLQSLVKLNLQVFVPAFIFVHLVESPLPGALAARVFFFTLTMIFLLFLLASAWALLRRWPAPERRALQLGAMFQNAGNFGIPIMALAYPGEGVAIEVFVIAAVNISTFTLGVFIASSGQVTASGWRRFLPVLRQMSVWAIVSAFSVRQSGLPLTEWNAIWVPLVYLKQGLVAIALMTLGVQLSKTQIDAAPLPKVGFALLLRLLVAPTLAVPISSLFGFEGKLAAMAILTTTFPTAVNTALIAHDFRNAPGYAAAIVFYSTLTGAVTVTAAIAVLRMIFPH